VFDLLRVLIFSRKGENVSLVTWWSRHARKAEEQGSENKRRLGKRKKRDAVWMIEKWTAEEAQIAERKRRGGAFLCLLSKRLKDS